MLEVLVPNGMIWSSTQSFGEKKKSGGWDIIEDDRNLFRSRLYKILPKGIFDFIVFDGERLDSFFTSMIQPQKLKLE